MRASLNAIQWSGRAGTDNQMERMPSAAITDFRRRLARRGIQKDAVPTRAVTVVREELVPVIGNVHIPTGRTAKRKDVDRRFRKLKF